MCTYIVVLLLALTLGKDQYVGAESEWNTAHATFYGGSDAGGTTGGACGYGDLYSTGYGTNTVAISSALFDRGLACGACYEVKCAGGDLCASDTSAIQVTVTNFCPPNPDLPDNNGGWCNLPLHHFDMSMPAFQQIATYQAGIVPVMYRRTACMKTGGIRFSLSGHNFLNLVLVTNVGGMGDVQAVFIRGSRMGKWVTMVRNFGQIWQSSENMSGQSLSFMVTTSDGKTVVSDDVAPPEWAFGQTYEGNQF